MSASFLPAVDYFLCHESDRVPDYSGCRILIPHHHAAEAFKRALAQRLPAQHLVPPRLLSLPQLVSNHTQNGAHPGRRLAEIHEFLTHANLIPANSLWPAAQELAALFDELDSQEVGANALSLMVNGNPLIDLESEIVRQLWAANRSSGLASHAQRYVHGLRSQPVQPGETLYTLGLAALSRPERDFLSRCAEAATVIDLPVPPRRADRWQTVVTAWQDDTAPLLERAQRTRTVLQKNPLQDSLRLISAGNLEDLARAGEAQLVTWLEAGLRDIALLAMDRLLARRLRALAERRGILVRDETGWALSTAAASHVVDGWLAINERLDSHRDLIDLLKSPLVLADTADLRGQALHELELTWRQHGSVATLKEQLAFARRWQLGAAETVLQRLIAAQAERPGRAASLSRWTRWLIRSLDAIGTTSALRADVIGRQLLQLIEGLDHALADCKAKFNYSDWRRWLLMQIEAASFNDDSVDSPVRLTHLSAARLRDWEAVLVLGVDAGHLPGAPKKGLFNDRVRQQLGLPDQTERETQQQNALLDIISRSSDVALLWQLQNGTEPQALSPWLIGLDSFQRLAWGQGIKRIAATSSASADISAITTSSSPSADHLPTRLSVSAWQSLVTCPYQFYARHLLGLQALDDVPEELDKADYGSLVHAILARFHSTYPVLSKQARDVLLADLQSISEHVFAKQGRGRYSDSLWQLRWLKHLPAYLDWAQDWETQGHQYQFSEHALSKTVQWTHGEVSGECLLHGRADRIDAGPGGPSVLDYKTQSEQTLRRKAQAAGEDVQLSSYAWLADASEAVFVGIDQQPVRTFAGKETALLAAQAEAERLKVTLSAVAAGSKLPAQGAPQACQWCEMRGLCRKQHEAA